jgi:GT2 family glycosyltransferase
MRLVTPTVKVVYLNMASQGRFSVPRLSILIPALSSAQRLEHTLVSVLANRPERCEVVVVLAHAYDDPYDLDDEVRFVSARRGAGLAECANLGLRECRAPFVHLLACGATVEEGWTHAPLQHFQDDRVAAVAPLVLDEHDPPRIASTGLEYHPGGVRRLRARGLATERARELTTAILGPTAQAAFYRHAAVSPNQALFDPSLGDPLADADLALRLRQAGYLARFEPESIVYCADDDAPQRGDFDAARHAERLFWRHAPVSGRTRSIAMHSLVVAGEFCQGFPRLGALTRLAGRLVGGCDWGFHGRQRRRWALPPVAGRLEPTVGIAATSVSNHAEATGAVCRSHTRHAPRDPLNHVADFASNQARVAS